MRPHMFFLSFILFLYSTNNYSWIDYGNEWERRPRGSRRDLGIFSPFVFLNSVTTTIIYRYYMSHTIAPLAYNGMKGRHKRGRGARDRAREGDDRGRSPGMFFYSYFYSTNDCYL
jgi:hypothetical protein